MSNYKESHFLRLQDYIAEGSKGELTEEERQYEDLLFSVAGIIRREGKSAAMAWLQADRDCSRHVADRICSEAVNLFYATDSVRAEAWRNLLFEKLLTATIDWEHTFITTDEETGERRCTAKAKDFEAYAKLLKEAAKIKKLSSDGDDSPQRLTATQINVFNTDATKTGIPQTDRRAIIQNPYFQQLRKKDQQRLEMEIGIRPLDIDEVMDNSIELANEVTGE